MLLTHLRFTTQIKSVLALAIALSPYCQSFADDQTEWTAQVLQKNPSLILNSQPYRIIKGRSQIRKNHLFDSVQSMIEAKDQLRATYCDNAADCSKTLSGQNPWSLMPKRSALESFVEGAELRDDLAFLSDTKFRSGKAKTAPWSGDYWGTFRGGITYRYADPSAPTNTNDYQKYRNYHNSHRPQNLSQATAVNILSPSEKYDLLVSDERYTLTEALLLEADDYYKENKNNIPAWFGICHGWAPAAIMEPRPTKSIVAASAGPAQKIQFRPDDLKALSSQLWANAAYPAKQLGGRCTNSNPKKDENGRLLDEACFDINPAQWHLLVMNELGVYKRSFVFDATFDEEVWNQPIYSYKIKYFDPLTGKESEDINKNIIAKNAYENDPFKKYRSPNAQYILGVKMIVTYVVETVPTDSETDSEEMDARTSATYMYDLELDENKKVIGGEWYYNAHPDFAWAPMQNAKAMTYEDQYLDDTWKWPATIPTHWLDIIKQSSYWRRSPLGTIINQLMTLSSGEGK